CPYPLLEAIAWNLVFMALNIYWIARLLLERRRPGDDAGSRKGSRIHGRPAPARLVPVIKQPIFLPPHDDPGRVKNG
ncbi:MAG: hypothetical protein ACE5MM_06465, partial [Nitrospiraceae bacterium]